jgi:guanylate kinase
MSQEKPNPFNPLPSRPLLIVISGLAGVGKDSILKKMKDRQVPFHFVVTATTRKPRPDERHGVDYYFFSHEQFNELIKQNKLLEHALVYNDHKGVPRDQVDQALASGKDVIMRIDVQGAATIRTIFPEAILIFVTTKYEQEFETRLKNRRTETPEDLSLRIITAHKELERIPKFDYVVVNRDGRLEDTVDTILAIIKAEHHRVLPGKFI